MKGKKGFRAFVDNFVEIANKTHGFGRVPQRSLGKRVWACMWVLGQGGFNDRSKS